MKVTITATGPAEKEQFRAYNKARGKPSIIDTQNEVIEFDSPGGCVMGYGPKMHLELHQWGALPDAVVNLAVASAQMQVNCMGAIANGTINARLQAETEQADISRVARQIAGQKNGGMQ